MSLEAIAGELQVSKSNISINIREAERLGMVKKVWKKGDRKDYYEAGPNLWQIIRRITDVCFSEVGQRYHQRAAFV